MNYRGLALVVGVATVALTSSAVLAQQGALPASDQTVTTETPQPAVVKMLPERVTTSKAFTVAVALGSPPDDFRNANGEISGWEIDILRAATQVMGLQFDLRPTTFDTLIPGLQSKRFDAAIGQMGVTEVREKVVDMIGTLKGNQAFAALSANEIKVNSLADICGVTVATTRGSREVEFAEAYQPQCAAAGKQPINLLIFSDGNGAADSLMSKRADLFWLGSTAVGYFVNQSKGKAKIVGTYTNLAYIGVALSKDSDMSAPLQAAIQHLVDDGTYKAIVSKWGLGDGSVTEVLVNPTGTPK